MDSNQSTTDSTIRIDRWLWFARFLKSRSLAAKLVQSRKVRLNSVVVAKPSVMVRTGDTLTFPQGKEIRVIRIVANGTRRGPAPEAQALYEDLAPKEEKKEEQTSGPSTKSFERDKGSGRPTKADRRAMDKLRTSDDNE